MMSERSPSSDVACPANGADTSLPAVTAVLVCWNHERFVRQAVLSALQQTYPNVQFIVFDNGSTDGSRRELEALAREYSFTLVFQDNIGLVRALNKGLSLASGKYFAPLATDDVWLPDKIERQVMFLEANPDVHMVCGGIQAIDENDHDLGFAANRPGEVTFKGLMRNGCSVQGPTVMSRTDTLRHVGGYDENVRVEDYAMALRFTHDGHRVVCLDEVYTKYRRHGKNWTSRPIWPERIEIGYTYRHDPEYAAFVRCNLRGYFRWLAGQRKGDALRLMLKEPIAWTWDDVGVGLIKLMVPASVLRWRQRRSGTI